VIRVSRRSRRHEDRAGDPLDGLVNMFDVGLVLAVGFLLAALASLGLSGAVTRHGLSKPPRNTITAPVSAAVRTLSPSPQRTIGRGRVVGKVYRLNDGRLVYVVPQSVLPTAPVPTLTPTAAPS
jgi:hypothetical protein